MNFKKKNFVFSSVGENTNFHDLWIGDNMDYDIYIIYYGNNNEIYNKYKSKVNYIEKRKGSKFQNFKYFYDKYTNIVNYYERFFILDDDIIINVKDINYMFYISKVFNLDICGPSFSKNSKISHQITKHKPGTLLSYTNFVEVNIPLFNKLSLQKLMEKLDSTLIGWGIDILYIHCNGLNKKNSYAIIHKIICENPKDDKKNTERELKNVENYNKRKNIWLYFAKKHNITPDIYKIVYKDIMM